MNIFARTDRFAVAIYKKDVDIAVGNMVDSNIFNIFYILGVSAVISLPPFSSLLMQGIIVTIIATALLFAFMFINNKNVLE